MDRTPCALRTARWAGGEGASVRRWDGAALETHVSPGATSCPEAHLLSNWITVPTSARRFLLKTSVPLTHPRCSLTGGPRAAPRAVGPERRRILEAEGKLRHGRALTQRDALPLPSLSHTGPARAQLSSPGPGPPGTKRSGHWGAGKRSCWDSVASLRKPALLALRDPAGDPCWRVSAQAATQAQGACVPPWKVRAGRALSVSPRPLPRGKAEAQRGHVTGPWAHSKGARSSAPTGHPPPACQSLQVKSRWAGMRAMWSLLAGRRGEVSVHFLNFDAIVCLFA